MIAINRPHTILLLFSILLIIVGKIHSWTADIKTVDLQLHDTYFVIHIFHLYMVMSLMVALVALLYFLFRKAKLNKILTVIHVAIFSLCISLLLMIIISKNDLSAYSDFILNEREKFKTIVDQMRAKNRITYITTAILIFSPLIFIFNIISSKLKRK